MSKQRSNGVLEVGNVIHIGNPLLKEELCFYRVTGVEGNKAVTGFRVFNRAIHYGGYVYEYGKRQNNLYNNTYTVSSEEDAKRAGATVR